MASLSAFLNVSDIQTSVKFYEQLGFELTDSHEHEGELAYATLEMDGAVLELGNIHANQDPDFQAWVSGELGAGVMFYLNVEDPDTIHERAVDAGAVIEHPPEDRPYGRTFMLNDPDGYAIGFISPA